MTGIIYKHTCKITGKSYIGQTRKSLLVRTGPHGEGYFALKKFGQAIKKYGWDTFESTILEVVEAADVQLLLQLLNQRERYYIELYDSYKHGYNADLGGNSKIVSEETKQKLSLINTGKKHTPESIAKMSMKQKGRKKSRTDNYGKSRIGIPLSDETKRKIGAKNKGRPSPRKGVTPSQETRLKLSIARRGKLSWNSGMSEVNRLMIDETLQRLETLCNQLMNTTSRKEKEKILYDNREDSEFVNLLRFLLDQYIVTGIRTKRLEKELDPDKHVYEGRCTFMTLLQRIESNPTGSYNIVYQVKCFMRLHPEHKEFVKSVVTRTLRLGIQATTVNRIIPGCCRTFEIMLGDRYFDNPDKYVPQGINFILTQKLDGVRCVCLKRPDGNTSFYSRQGQPFEDLVDIEQEMRSLPAGYVYDGELLLVNKDNLPSKDLYRATVKVTNSDNVKNNIIFNCFDILPIEDFYNGYCSIKATERKKLLSELTKDCKWIQAVPILYEGTDKERISYHLDSIVSNGGEGVMINLSDSPYECKRSRGLLKVKKMQTCDIHCIGMEEGTGNFSGTLGAIQCEFLGPDGKLYPVKVGSGFSLDDRNLFWNNRDLIVNKIVETQYFEVTTNEQGTYSLRFPVFKQVRNDKDEISMY